MIEIMFELYIDNESKVGYGWSEKMLMDHILKGMEDAGMLPPLNHDLLDKFELGNDLRKYHQWEEK